MSTKIEIMPRKLFIITLTVLMLILIALLNGCLGESKEVVEDGDFKIELLFEKDGYKMYRFKDNGRYIYWATPIDKNGSVRVQNDYTVNQGKHTKTVYVESITSE